MGAFDKSFLSVPPECLITSMKTHQKCFSLRDPRSKKLAAKFLLVSNLKAKDGGKEIVAGNEKVIAARLSDAKFFWEQDLKKKLEPMHFELKGITFHEKLGTQWDRMERVTELSRQIAGAVDAEPELAGRAAQLAKADLVSGMVGEFPELQGLMGRYYAEAEKMHPKIAAAIEEHYKPKGASDTVPTAPVSIAVALADKLDTLVGFWSIGEKPTGSGDPYQLRRAALGIIRIVLENDLRLPLPRYIAEVYLLHCGRADPEGAANVRGEVEGIMQEQGVTKDAAFALFEESDRLNEAVRFMRFAPIVSDLMAFFAERLKVHLRDKGARHDLIDAVFSLGGQDDLALIVKRVEALDDVPQDRRRRQPACRRQARAEHPRDRGEEGQDELRRHLPGGASQGEGGGGARSRHREREAGHGRGDQRGELRRRHARARRAARACRRLLRQGDRQLRGAGAARQPPVHAVGDPRGYGERRRLHQDRRLAMGV